MMLVGGQQPPEFVDYVGHDPAEGPDGTDILITVWRDGAVTAATRPGRDRTEVTWRPAENLTAKPLAEVLS